MSIERVPNNEARHVSESDMSYLEGKVLTIVDASLSDPTQRKAVKDLITSAIWIFWHNSMPSAGIPLDPLGPNDLAKLTQS